MIQLSPYKKHVERWKDCQECTLCHGRSKVIIARGQVPCDVLFIGEAPGVSENVLGKPFVGPAGQLLDRIIFKAFKGIDKLLTYALTNLVGCIPLDETGNKAGQPDDAEIMACAPRLQEFYALCKPRLVVCVGQLAEVWIDFVIPSRQEDEVPVIHIAHPAYIIRANYAQQGLMEQRCVVQISTALEDL